MMPSYCDPGYHHFIDSKYPVIDLRSDTVSRPTPAMRKAMFEAEVGDDVTQEDPTVNRLEKRVAELFKKEASIFLSSGTMGNLIAVMAHCDKRGCEVIMGDQGHTFLYEQGAMAQVAAVHPRTIPNLPDGTFDLEVLESSIRGDDVHSPITQLVVVENTQNICGGRVIPLDYLDKLSELCKKYKLDLHMDGARVFNAAVYLKVPVSRVTEKVDSVSFCFSKGLGAPVGSMLVGSKELIRKARRLRKVLGGALRQSGVIAAPCEVALDCMIDRMAEDHANARKIAQAIHDLKTDIISVDLDVLQTNILMIDLKSDLLTETEFCQRMREVTDDEAKLLKEKTCIVRVLPKSFKVVRAVTYYEVTEVHVDQVIAKIRYIVEEVKQKKLKTNKV